ncbi:hypothetical protein GCM10020369_29270 [Cryptosporangium minutisporangium]|uniref:Uncharacterized protein n=1 Tax=Cryptosporangium minutisporangium TaxID=113569 RepID=A0ABP6SY66_9ACTN
MIGAFGDLLGAYRFLGEIGMLHNALRSGDDTVENLDPGTALPTVFVLGGFSLGFALVSGLVAVLILRGSRLGLASLRGAIVVLLPARLLAYLATYIRYQEYVDAMPPQTRDPAYRSVIIGQVFGGGVGTAGVVAAVTVVLGAALVRWFRPRTDQWAAPAGAASVGSSAAAINTARILALVGTVVVLLVPVAWVRPLDGEAELPSEWSFVALVSGALAVGALVAAGITILARPGRLLFRWLALGALALVAAMEWVVTLWQSFYADAAYGAERIDGVAGAWTAAVGCGIVGSALLTGAVVALTVPPVPSAAGEATEGAAAGGVTVTRRADGSAPERIGEASPEPAWQAFPDADAPASAAPEQSGDATRTAEPGSGSR